MGYVSALTYYLLLVLIDWRVCCVCSQPVEILDLLDGLLTLDADKRLKAGAALDTPWLRSVASFQPTDWSLTYFLYTVPLCLLVR